MLWWLSRETESCYIIRKLMKSIILACSLTHSIIAINYVFPKFTYWNWNPSVLAFGGGALGRPLGPKDGALVNGIMILSFLCPSSRALLLSLSNHTLQPWEFWVLEAASLLGGWDSSKGSHRVRAWEGTESVLPPLNLKSACTLKVLFGHTWIIAKIDFLEVLWQGYFRGQ